MVLVTRARAVSRRTWAVVLVVLMLATLVVAAAPRAESDSPDLFKLTILHHNDGESDLLPDGDFGGVARFATLAKELRTEAKTGPGRSGVILVSAGDNFLAGPELNASLAKGPAWYDAIALDQMSYDAFVFGNHEFDLGPDALRDFIFSFKKRSPNAWLLDAPFLGANLDFSGEPKLQKLVDQGRIAKSTIVSRGNVSIGIVGATTSNLPFISSPRNVTVGDVATAVQAEVDRLTQRGVRIIVLAAHLQGLNEDAALIPLLSGVDVAIAGGGDELLANPGDLLIPGDEGSIYGSYPQWVNDKDNVQVPIVTGPGDYTYLGQLVTYFNRQGELVMIDDAASGPKRVSGVAPDAVVANAKIQTNVVDPVAAFVADLASNVIGTSQVALEGRRDPGIRTQETNLGNLMADSLLWQATQLAADFGMPTPDVGLQNGGGIRNNDLRPAGDFTELDTFDIAPFTNYVTIVPDIPRDQFKQILENAVSQVENVSGRFAQIAGFTMVYDPAGTPMIIDDEGNVTQEGSRVKEVTLEGGTVIVTGGVVQAGDAITIATIDFLAGGGDQYPYNDAPFTRVGVTYQQALADYVVTALSGVISSADYPEVPVGGGTRITTVP